MTKRSFNFIRVDHNLPDHPKWKALKSSAKVFLVEVWCLCDRMRNDGLLSARVWDGLSTARIREELVAAGWVDPLPDGSYQVHDYLDHQRSRAEAEALSRKRSSSGRQGARSRWGSEPMANAMANAMPGEMANSMASATGGAWQVPMANDGKFMAEESRYKTLPVVAEVQEDKPGMANAIDQGVVSAVVIAIRDRTGRTVSANHARLVARDILGDPGAPERIASPPKYVAAVIAKAPLERYAPVTTPPQRDWAAERDAARANGAGPPPGTVAEELAAIRRAGAAAWTSRRSEQPSAGTPPRSPESTPS